MLRQLGSESQSHVEHACIEQIPRVFHIRSHAHLLLRSRILQPIFPLNVVRLSFARSECGELQGSERLRIEVARQRSTAEERAKLVLFLPVEIYAEASRVVHRSKLRIAFLGAELIFVV